MAEVEDIMASAALVGIDFSTVDLDSIRLPPGENFGIVSDDEDLKEDDELKYENAFGNIIVVDHLPVVPEEKIVKLKGVIHRKIHSQIGGGDLFKFIVRSEYMPIDPDTKKTRGCYFIEYNTPQEAKAVKLNLNGYKLDKSHIIAVNLLDEIDMFMQDDWARPVTRPYTAGENLQQWLTDEKARDQFVIRAGSDTEVLWNDARHLKPDLVYKQTCWSPTDPILALFVPEHGGGNQTARVSLVQIPSKEEVRQKNLFSVSDCKMYWQSNGDYLAVKVDKYTKTKKRTYTGFELFRIKERDIPIEVLELENKNDKVIAFAWEPKGHRFAIIHGDNSTRRPDVSFYSMRTTHNFGKVSKLTTLKGMQANALYWSPAGRFIVLAGLKGLNGQLVFYDVDDLETMATAEHFMATDIEWDPTGRYVATAITCCLHEMENGFNIWSFNGKLLYRILKDRFFQFLWRHRPPSLLTPEKEEQIAKNLKKYSKKYEAEDQDVSLQLSEREREKRRVLREEWGRWVSEWKQRHEEEKLERERLRDGEASDEEEK